MWFAVILVTQTTALVGAGSCSWHLWWEARRWSRRLLLHYISSRSHSVWKFFHRHQNCRVCCCYCTCMLSCIIITLSSFVEVDWYAMHYSLLKENFDIFCWTYDPRGLLRDRSLLFFSVHCDFDICICTLQTLILTYFLTSDTRPTATGCVQIMSESVKTLQRYHD